MWFHAEKFFEISGWLFFYARIVEPLGTKMHAGRFSRAIHLQWIARHFVNPATRGGGQPFWLHFGLAALFSHAIGEADRTPRAAGVDFF